MRFVIGLFALVVVMGACQTAQADIPPPRPIVNHSGARIRADHERMRVVNEWVSREIENIDLDPSFLVISVRTTEELFPWEGLEVRNDSVSFPMPITGVDAERVYQIYGHLHLMVEMGRQEEWLPEAPTATGYELERAIVKRCADAWVLGRTVFDTQPFNLMDELAYSSENGYLDPFIFTARPNDFASERTEWVRANPTGMDDYREWFINTFNREPPGLRSN